MGFECFNRKIYEPQPGLVYMEDSPSTNLDSLGHLPAELFPAEVMDYSSESNSTGFFESPQPEDTPLPI